MTFKKVETLFSTDSVVGNLEVLGTDHIPWPGGVDTIPDSERRRVLSVTKRLDSSASDVCNAGRADKIDQLWRNLMEARR